MEDIERASRPQLRQRLLDLGLQPPFPRSNRDLRSLIEVTLRSPKKTLKSKPVPPQNTQNKTLKKTGSSSRPILKKSPPEKLPVPEEKVKLPLAPPKTPNTKTPNLNKIVQELEVLQRDYFTKVSTLEDPEERKKEKKSYTFKSYNLRTAIRHLKDRFKDNDIQTAEEAVGIPRLGKETLSKIKEILDRGHLERADKIRQDPRILLKESLMGVYGIGSVKANQLIDEEGISSLDMLKTRLDLLNDVQRVGLQYYEDINARIPYKEMKGHDRFLQSIIKDIDPEAILTIAGSYRRQKKDSGDIDVLLTHPTNPEGLLTRVIQKLHETNYIIATLVSGDHKFHGLSQLDTQNDCNGICRPRRIDFLYCSYHEYPFALLHFTGSGSFNQMIRCHAQKMKLSLSEHGLKRHDGKRLSNKFETERDIFDFLGVEWLHPKDREHLPKFR